MFTMRWQYSFSLTTVILFMLHSSPVIAASELFFPHLKDNLIRDEDLANRETLFVSYPSKTIIADTSVTSTESKKPFNLLQQLNLTSEQQRQIRRIHHKYRQKIRQKKSSLNLLQNQLSDMMVGTEKVELIRAKNEQLLALRQEIEKLRFESMLATREILTLQQRLKFREIMESQLAQ